MAQTRGSVCLGKRELDARSPQTDGKKKKKSGDGVLGESPPALREDRSTENKFFGSSSVGSLED